MPIYEYGCDKCGHVMEVFQKMSDPAPAKCENCGSKRVKRLMSRTSFQLKGEGWYITDYARKGQKDPGASESKDSKDAKDSKETGDAKTSADSKDSKSVSKESKSDAKKAESKKKDSPKTA